MGANSQDSITPFNVEGFFNNFLLWHMRLSGIGRKTGGSL